MFPARSASPEARSRRRRRPTGMGNVTVLRAAFLYNSARIIGGGEIGFTELIRRASDTSDIEPIPLVPAPGEVSDLLDRYGIPWREFPMPRLRGLGVLRLPGGVLRLARFIRHEHIDIVHANGARCTLYAGFAGRLSRVPVIWHVRVLERNPFLDALRGALAARIICISRAVEETLLPLRTPQGKTVVIYNGVDQEPFRTAAPADVHAMFGIPPERRLVLVAALIVRWKGQADVIEALGCMSPEQRRTVQVLFAGRELTPGKPFTAFLQARARQLGVDGHITWCGHRSDLPSLMRGSDVLLLASHGEPFGRVIVEAWAAGLPVISTSGGGAGEIIEHGRTGWLIPQQAPEAMAEALFRVLNDAELRARLAEEGRRRADDYTVERHAEAVFDLYRTIVRTQDRRGSGSG